MSWWRSTTRRPRRPSFEMFWRIRSSMISRFLICAWLDIVRMFWIDQVPHANVKAAVSKCGKSSYDSSCAMATSGDYSRSFHSFCWVVFHVFQVLQSKDWCFRVPFSFDGATLTVTVKCDVNAVRSFGETEYYVTVVKAKGGRKDGKGRKDPLGVDYHCTCTCGSYKVHFVCKHIACLCIVHFNWIVHCDHIYFLVSSFLLECNLFLQIYDCWFWVSCFLICGNIFNV